MVCQVVATNPSYQPGVSSTFRLNSVVVHESFPLIRGPIEQLAILGWCCAYFANVTIRGYAVLKLFVENVLFDRAWVICVL